jgi:hypothetical protein
MTQLRSPTRSTSEGEVHRCLSDDPAQAFELLVGIRSAKTRRQLGSLIAQKWARTDINRAWTMISNAPLSPQERQRLLNELWS